MKLNIGCGDAQPDGWENVDVADNGQAHLASIMALPFEDRSADYAVAHHMLQYVGYLDLVPALAEVRRVLAPKGVFRISVPSFLGAVRAHARGDADWFPDIVGDETTLDGRFCTYITGYSVARSVFTPSWLVELCERAGFELATPAQHEFSPLGGGRHADICDLDGRKHESIYVEARR